MVFVKNIVVKNIERDHIVYGIDGIMAEAMLVLSNGKRVSVCYFCDYEELESRGVLGIRCTENNVYVAKLTEYEVNFLSLCPEFELVFYKNEHGAFCCSAFEAFKKGMASFDEETNILLTKYIAME